MADEIAFKTKVLASSSRNTCLLLRLSSLSDGPSALHNHIAAVTRLQEELARQTATIENLKQEADTLFIVHRKFQESISQPLLRRPAHKQEKFEAEALKAEHQYFAALAAQSKAQERKAQLQRRYEEAVAAQKPLEKTVRVYEEVRRELEDMYDTLFGGPSPGFPHEDERESVFNTSKSENEVNKERIRKTREASRLLNQAQGYLERAGSCFRNAQRRAAESKFFLGYAVSTLSVGAKRVAEASVQISAAEEHLTPLSTQNLETKEALVADLQALQDILKDFGSRKLILSAVRTAQSTLPEADTRLKELIEVVKEEEREAISELERTAKLMEDTGQELQQVRQEIFEEIAGFGQAAPAYDFVRRGVERCDMLEESYDVSELEKELELEARLAERNVLPEIGRLEPPEYEEGTTFPRSDFEVSASIEVASEV